jgi:hypothetical protein
MEERGRSGEREDKPHIKPGQGDLDPAQRRSTTNVRVGNLRRLERPAPSASQFQNAFNLDGDVAGQ